MNELGRHQARSTYMQEIIIKIIDDIRGSWRYRWVGLSAAWVCCLAGWAFVMTMPNVYEAKARVYVDSRTVLGPLLRGLALDPNVESELSVVRQALLSRPSIEKVARKTDLDLRATTPEEKEALLNSLLQRIRVTTEVRTPSSATDGVYAIAFQDHSREKAVAVVETLLNTFVEDTLGTKRTGQESAQRFLDDEIAELERRLSEAETRLADFKKRNVGVMPDSQGDYFARLQAEMLERDGVVRALRLAESRRAELQRQLSGEDPFLFGFDTQPAAQEADTGDLAFRIREMEARLEQMLLRYTEKHPEVVALRATIDELKGRMEEEIARAQSTRRASASLASSLKSNPIYQGIQAEMNRTDVQIAELRQELAERNQRVAELQRLVDTVPEVEAELARLNRDYEITRQRYLELVERRETAKLSESAEKQGVIKFQIIDPPIVGLEPVAPPRAVFLIGVLLAGLGAAGALMYGLNLLHPVYLNTRVLAAHTGRTVLGAVSRTWPESEKAQMQRRAVLFSGAASLLIVSCVLVVALNGPMADWAQRILGRV
jgi:polysaccharide chain length determinant protein (PEP-CTERM system associated)